MKQINSLPLFACVHSIDEGNWKLHIFEIDERFNNKEETFLIALEVLGLDKDLARPMIRNDSNYLVFVTENQNKTSIYHSRNKPDFSQKIINIICRSSPLIDAIPNLNISPSGPPDQGHQKSEPSTGYNLHPITEIELTNIENIQTSALKQNEKNIVAECAQQVGTLLYLPEGSAIFSKIGSVVRVSKNLVITARHCLNGLSLNEIFIVYQNDDRLYFFDSLMEDGSLHSTELDYAILKMEKSILKAGATLIREQKDVEGARVWIGNTRDGGMQFHTRNADTSTEHALQDISYVPTTAGSSGGGHFSLSLADLDPMSGLYAIHSKKSQSGMFHNQRTGLLIQSIIDNNKNSLLCNLDPNTEYTLPTLLNIAQPFDCFFGSVSAFDEIEESLREDYLGKTPQLNDIETNADITKATAYGILRRWERKRKALYTGNKAGETRYRDWKHWIVSVKIETSNVVPTPGNWRTNGKIETAQWLNQTVKAQTDHSSYSAYLKAQRAAPPVLLTKPIFTRAWIYLGAKIPAKSEKKYCATIFHNVDNLPILHKGKSPKAAFNMGHKLSAVQFVKNGSGSYWAERLNEKKASPKYKNKLKLFAQKQQEYIDRYDKYRTSGYLNYKNNNKQANLIFMADPNNYKFEWGMLNQIDGADIGTRAEGRYPPLPKITAPKK